MPASVICTVKIMPESPSVDLKVVETQALAIIKKFAKGQTKSEEQPIGFGIKALVIMFVMDESLGSPDFMEADMLKIAGIQSFETTDCRRTIG